MSKRIEQKVKLLLMELEELSAEERELIDQAKVALKKAYAPYSNFNVGAAVLLENGRILSSNNQENVSFPVGICAERNLLAYAHANHPTSPPLKLAIAAKRTGDTHYASVSPCGLCRQTINEYENKFKRDIEIFMLSADGKILKAENISQLLPFKFSDLNQ